MIIARSLWRKAIATAFAAAAFVSLYEVTMIDSKYAARQAVLRETTAEPSPGARLAFSATAYCKGATTTSGVAAQTGVAAADPQLLPVGSVIEIYWTEPRYNCIYTIMDTGPSVQGRQVDIYVERSKRYSWPPSDSTPGAPPRLEPPGQGAYGSMVQAARTPTLPAPSDGARPLPAANPNEN